MRAASSALAGSNSRMMARSASREKDTPVSRKRPCSIASTSALWASRRGGRVTGLDRRDDLAQSTSRNTKHKTFCFWIQARTP
jgi:hypothetical protein